MSHVLVLDNVAQMKQPRLHHLDGETFAVRPRRLKRPSALSYRCRPFGSRISLRPSPRRLNPRTVRKMAIPGNNVR